MRCVCHSYRVIRMGRAALVPVIYMGRTLYQSYMCVACLLYQSYVWGRAPYQSYMWVACHLYDSYIWLVQAIRDPYVWLVYVCLVQEIYMGRVSLEQSHTYDFVQVTHDPYKVIRMPLYKWHATHIYDLYNAYVYMSYVWVAYHLYQSYIWVARPRLTPCGTNPKQSLWYQSKTTFSLQLVAQINLMGVYGVETPPPRIFWCGMYALHIAYMGLFACYK